MTRPWYSPHFAASVQDRIEDGSYTDRYIARTNSGGLYLTDTGSTENKISTEYSEGYDIDEVILLLAPAAGRAEEVELMAERLFGAGEFYHGGRVEEVAVEWIDAGFDSDTAKAWMIAKVWQAWVARDLVALGRTPGDLRNISDDLIYAWCNNDLALVWPADTEAAR